MSKNIQRLAEDIKREISVTMREVVTDGIVSVSHCELTNDLSYCKVYISTFEGGEKTVEAAEALKSKAGLFKKHINARIKMRKIPELIFLPDNSLDYYDKITGIIDELKAKQEPKRQVARLDELKAKQEPKRQVGGSADEQVARLDELKAKQEPK